MIIARWRALSAALTIMVMLVPCAPAQTAQSVPPAQAVPGSQGVPNALQGFSQNHDQPVKIDAMSLEVRDKDKVATFIGDVHLTQGDTTLTCKTLVVYYEQDATTGSLPAAQPGPGGQQQIRRLEAKGGVVVTQKDQTATGNSGEFDMKTNLVTLTGNVVVTQGQNVLRGERLVVDMTTGVSRVDPGKSGHGRVEGLFLPGSQRDNRLPNSGAPKEGSTKPAPPMKLN